MHHSLDVRIIHLAPMLVASVTGTTITPEHDAWVTLLEWARDYRLLHGPIQPRFFGINTPPSISSKTDHNYEACMTVDADAPPNHVVKIKTLEGGLYVVTHVHGLESVAPTWQRLSGWVVSSNFSESKRPCLEEHLAFIALPPSEYDLDLYLPVEE